MRPVDVRDLLHKPGASRRVSISERLEGLSTELAAVPQDTSVVFDVLVESVVDGVLVSGKVRGRMALRCARCLKDFSDDFELGVRELFTHAPLEEEDHYPITDGEIDLEPLARDNVLLSMPFSPLCKPDCLGLCARCGGDRNLGECSCGPEIDERWAALSSLKLED